MFRRFTGFATSILVAGILTSPGLGTVDLCLAQQRICHEAKVKSCCCTLEEPRESEAPCCVTVHQDWMLPLKEGAAKFSAPEFAILETGAAGGIHLSQARREARPGMGSPDPPPRSRATRLALIQVRLV